LKGQQIAEIKNNKNNQLGDNPCAGTVQIQPEPAVFDVTSNISESNEVV